MTSALNLWLSCALAGICLCGLFWLIFRALIFQPQAQDAASKRHTDLPQKPKGHWQTLLARVLVQAGMGQSWTVRRWLVLQGFLAIVVGLTSLGAAFLLQQSVFTTLLLAIIATALILICPLLWLSARVRERQRLLLRQLPFFLDLLTLCVEAGQSLQSALQQAAQYGPDGLMKQELLHVLAQLRTGLARADAFDALYTRTGLPALAQFALSLRQSDQFGISLGAVLRAQAAQQRDARFTRAEKLALQAPVKMLFPLVCCIFPCTFLILGFPLLASFLQVLD